MYSVQFLLLLSHCSKSWQAQLQLQIHWAPPLQRTGGCQTWCLTVELKWLWVFVVRTLRRLKSNMPYGQELQETLQVARQQLKAVADNRECEGLPPKQWSRCNRQDLVEICVWARKKSRFWYCLQEDIRYMWGVVAACPHWFLRCRCDNVSPVAT